MRLKYKSKMVVFLSVLLFIFSTAFGANNNARKAATQNTYIYALQAEGPFPPVGAIKKYDSALHLLKSWPVSGVNIAASPDGTIFANEASFSKLVSYDYEGTQKAEWKVYKPYNFIVDDKGYVYVMEGGCGYSPTVIEKFDTSGKLLTTWNPEKSLPNVYSIGVDHSYRVYLLGQIIDKGDVKEVIGRYSNDGDFLGYIGETINHFPIGIVFDSKNNCYVLDFTDSNLQINKFDATGKYLLTFPVGKTGKRDIGDYFPSVMAIDLNDHIFILDRHNENEAYLYKYNTEGELISSFAISPYNFAIAVGAK